MKLALYVRVSTTRQAENDLSILYQLRQMRAWAQRNGHVVVKEFVDPGASATDDKRRVFQDMVAEATVKTPPFQAVIVHSLSRFFRDLIQGAIYQRKLLKAGVALISITQQTSDDSCGDMQRNLFMLFDEYQSKEIAKHTLRDMQENARQGFFNGAKASFGYKTVDAGQTGNRGRVKKKLAVEASEAVVVRKIFALYTVGINGPRIGMKEIAKTLNAEGVRLRGQLFRVQAVQQVLASTTYAGVHVFNKMDSKTRKIKDEADWVKVPVPAIIDQATFDAATRLRDAWLPSKCCPQREKSPNLLMGLLKCGHCGSSMSVVTGKGGRYKYYKCNSRHSKGDAPCPSKSYQLEKIDSVVLKAFKETIYTPEHMRAIIDQLRENLAKNKDPENIQRLKALETDLKKTEQAQSKLFEAIEQGILELDDQLKERAKAHKQTRDGLMAEIAKLKSQHHIRLNTLTPQKIDAVAKILAKRLNTPTTYSRAYLKATLSEIRISEDSLKLSGDRKAMADLIANGGQISADGAVPMFVPEWRPLIATVRTNYQKDVKNLLKSWPPFAS